MTDPKTDAAPGPATHRISTRAFTIGAIVAALVIACIVSIWASRLPDGLSYVAKATGMAAAEHPSATAGSPFAHYGAVFVDNPWLSLAIAGAIGCAITFGVSWIIGRVVKRRGAEG